MSKVLRVSDHALPNFDFIAPSVWEYTPRSRNVKTYSKSKDIDAPSMILLCTGTGAQYKDIAKYTKEYRSFFPSTRIMVITTSTKDLCFRSSQEKQERLKPAVKRISNYNNLKDHSICNNGILLHVFSEGGSNKACELAEAYLNTTSTRLPVSAMCCDSTPGHPRFLQLCKALNKALPQVPIVKYTGLFVGSIVLGVWVLYGGIKGKGNNVISRTRRRLQDPKHFDLTAPRCYFYSKNDAFIAWQDVQEHAEESMQQKTPVTNYFRKQRTRRPRKARASALLERCVDDMEEREGDRQAIAQARDDH